MNAGSLEQEESERKESKRNCAESRFGEGCWNLGFSAGYGVPFHFDDANTQVEDSTIVALFPRVAVGLTNPGRGDGWFRGNIEIGFEGYFVIQTAPHIGSGLGVSALLRCNFLASDRFSPFVEIGGGLIDLNFDLDPPRADGINFALQGNVGVHWHVWNRAAITARGEIA